MSILSGTVAGNATVSAADNVSKIEAENEIKHSFNGTAGISVAGQNAGANSMIQQNVNVQSNMDLGSGN